MFMIRRIRLVSVATSNPKIRAVAARRQQQRGEDLDQRRLAGAVGAEQPEELAGGDLEVDAVERDDRLRLGRVDAPDAGHGDGGRQVWVGRAAAMGRPMRTSCGNADATTAEARIGRWMILHAHYGCRTERVARPAPRGGHRRLSNGFSTDVHGRGGRRLPSLRDVNSHDPSPRPSRGSPPPRSETSEMFALKPSKSSRFRIRYVAKPGPSSPLPPRGRRLPDPGRPAAHVRRHRRRDHGRRLRRRLRRPQGRLTR